MTYAKYGILVLTLVLVLGFSALSAEAQMAYTGTFNLTTEAYWGPNLLQPGEYHIVMSLDQSHGTRSIQLTGEGVRATLLTAWGIPQDVSKRNSLELQQINGVYIVRKLDAGLVGRSYRFLASKNALQHAERTTASTPVTVTVPISTGGGN